MHVGNVMNTKGQFFGENKNEDMSCVLERIDAIETWMRVLAIFERIVSLRVSTDMVNVAKRDL